jgi:CHAD domain-containing protein
VLSEFVVVDDADELSVDALGKALSARVESRGTERRGWLDTFDWRLYRAGLVLEHRESPPGRSVFVLTDLEGQRLAQLPAPAGAVPSVDDLPAGPLKEQVVSRAGLRTAFVRASVEGRVGHLAVLDAEEKTVARVAIEGPLVVAGRAEPLPVRVRVEALRGYGKDARRVAERLGASPRVRRADDTLFEAICSAWGLQPGVYRSKPRVHLDPAMPAGRAFALLLDELVSIARVNVDGTLRQIDTEFLHDLRIAVRSSRSVLKVARGVFDERQRSRYAAELKWIGDVTTPSRDLDVYLLEFDDLVEHAMDPDAMRPFRTLLTRQCRKAHTGLNRALRSKRFARLLDGWPDELTASDEPGPDAEVPVVRVGGDRLRSAWRQVRRRGNAVTDASPPDALHDLRKRCKELRYLLEHLSSLYEKSAHREIVGELRQLQNNLGEYQDAENQRRLILQYAEELVAQNAPAKTLVGMGRLDHYFEHRQAVARTQFADHWTRFDSKHTRRAFATMLDSSR